MYISIKTSYLLCIILDYQNNWSTMETIKQQTNVN